MGNQLHNKVNRNVLKERLHNEPFHRKTISFYRYIRIANPVELRDRLYMEWEAIICMGRIYIAREGINAQMSVPEPKFAEFLASLENHPELKGIPLKYAIEDNGKSFYKLTIKVRPKIVADGLDDFSYDVTNVGNHLSALDFHDTINQPGTIVVDMRNHYESEIGHFENAYCPDADTFRDAIHLVSTHLSEHKDKKLLLYCTGGIRCEKASAYLKHHGFKDVNQLYGGIIEYARQIKQSGVPSKFIGKNFVFDDRLGERIGNQIISRCHQCGKPADTHVNCANEDCHLLFIQCPECQATYDGCCSVECRDIKAMPMDERKPFRTKLHDKYSHSKIYKSRAKNRVS